MIKKAQDFIENPTQAGFDSLKKDIPSLLFIYKESKTAPKPSNFFEFGDLETVCFNSEKEEKEGIINEMIDRACEFSHWAYINQFGVTKEQKARAFKEMNEGDWSDTKYF